MRSSLGAIALWLGVLTAVLVAGAVLFVGGEEGIPVIGARPQPVLEAIEGFAIDATDDLPAWRCARAEPVAAGSVVAIAGTVTELRLSRVVVELADGVELAADRGRFDTSRLRVDGNLRVERAGVRRLTAASAVFANGVVRFGGIAVFHPEGGARRSTGVDQTLELAALVEALR